jgi:hypothetical protein
MNETDPQLERIEQLLREGNDLRRQAIVAQQASLTLQKSSMNRRCSCSDGPGSSSRSSFPFCSC